MHLCVGATSRIVVEEAAKLRVPQIVASRRQVDEHGGYINVTPIELVEIVANLSGGETAVVRDHGGPYQNGDPDDDWTRALDIDVASGFDALHLDVSMVNRDGRENALATLVKKYRSSEIDIEVGGERADQTENESLLRVALQHDVVPSFGVIDVGGHVWADRQIGSFATVAWVAETTARYQQLAGVDTKAHNMDWCGNRKRFADVLDAYNVAPEFAAVEIDAWMRALPFDIVERLLNTAYASHRWERWFESNQGTEYERARCAMRYVWTELVTTIPDVDRDRAEVYVRQEVSNALRAG